MNLQWLVFVAFMFILIQALLFIRFGKKNVGYDRSFSKRAVFEGENVELIEVISNNKLLPMPWVRMESKFDSSLKFRSDKDTEIEHESFHRSLFSLMSFMKVTRRHQMTCTKRGCYDMKSVTLTGGDLFGIYHFTKIYDLDARLLVYPKLGDLDELGNDSHSFQGDITVKRFIIDDPFMLSGVREYMPGDPMNRINQSATARVGRLMVNNRDYTSDPRVVVILNMDVDENMWGSVTRPDLIEKGISYCASMINELLDMGLPTGFGTNGMSVDGDRVISVAPQAGAGQRTLLFDTLAKIQMKREVRFQKYLNSIIDEGASGMDYCIFTLYENKALANACAKLRAMGNSVRVIRFDKGVKM